MRRAGALAALAPWWVARTRCIRCPVGSVARVVARTGETLRRYTSSNAAIAVVHYFADPADSAGGRWRSPKQCLRARECNDVPITILAVGLQSSLLFVFRLNIRRP